MAFNRAADKFMGFRQTLALHPGRIKERFVQAWSTCLVDIDPEEDVPAALRREFRGLMLRTAGSSSKTHDQVAVQANIDKLSEEEVQLLASDFLALSFHAEKREETTA